MNAGSSGSLRQTGAGGADQGGQPVDLGLEDAAAGLGQAVVFARLAADSRLAAGDALDQALVLQAGEGAVERAVAQLERAAAESFDVLQDGIAVLLLLGDAQQDEKGRFPQGEVFFEFDRCLLTNMSVNDIL